MMEGQASVRVGERVCEKGGWILLKIPRSGTRVFIEFEVAGRQPLGGPRLMNGRRAARLRMLVAAR